MSKLPKFTLSKNKAEGTWDLKNDSTKNIVASYSRKEDATAGGALSSAIGPNGGSVRIRKIDQTIQEERTFPRSKDPRSSRG